MTTKIKYGDVELDTKEVTVEVDVMVEAINLFGVKPRDSRKLTMDFKLSRVMTSMTIPSEQMDKVRAMPAKSILEVCYTDGSIEFVIWRRDYKRNKLWLIQI